jgi:hypothetical protein
VALLDDSRDALVGDVDGVRNSALAAELEAQLRSVDRDMASAQRSQAE